MSNAVMFCCTPETFPPEIRNTAIGILSSVNTIASIISPVLASFILASTGDNLVFIILYAGAIFLATFCSAWVVETRNYDPYRNLINHLN